MELSFIDTHAHLDMAHFDHDRAGVITRAIESGVSTIITVGTDLESSEKAIKLAEQYPEVLVAVGFHPQEAARLKELDLKSLAELALHPRVVAVGEIGLDFYRGGASKETQLQVLKWQLELAEKVDRPVIIHCRNAEAALLAALSQWVTDDKRPARRLRGVVHCFSQDINTAQQYFKLGFMVSLGAYVGYPASRQVRNMVSQLPPDRFMLETDCPFLPPQDHRGQRNEPAYLPQTATVVAEVRQVMPEVIARETTINARYLFRLPSRVEN